jgi:glyoxylase-like metal-dependent hydrolase (beta-lactamase superfamily II)
VALSYDFFQVEPKPIPSQIPGFVTDVGQATWPPSTATLIWDDTDALLVDALITRTESERLAAWIGDRTGLLSTIYITHPHADHFLGLAAVLGKFPSARALALPDALPALRGQVSPAAMEVWGGFFPDQIVTTPVVPTGVTDDSLIVGDQTAILISVGTTDTDHSSVLHIPTLGLVVAGDVVYNDVHMWLAGSTPESRANWQLALDTVASLGADTVIAGHRSPASADDDAGRQIDDSRRYLGAFDDALQSSDSPEELIHRMTMAYPDLGNPYTLWLAAFDLLGGTAASESATER